jgi:CubicO group peptidase (beta-lactamase class C family)
VQCQTITNQFEAYLDRAANVWQFQGSYLVARGDSILTRGSRGYVDLAKERPLTPETKFLIGSLTKPFTAIAVLRLAEQGLVALDESVQAYLSDYPASSGGRITVHDLLSHRSGIPDLLTVPEFGRHAGKPIPPAELVDLFAQLPLDFAPGSNYAYSSSNYVLLALIVEAVSGISWQQYIQDNICSPLGMENTAVFADYASRPDFAQGQAPDRSGELVRVPAIDISRGYGAGALASTVDDLLKLHHALYSGRILGQDFVDLMLTPHSPTYGYGWLVDDFGGHCLTAHGGGAPGFVSMMQRWVDDSLCVIVLSNNVTTPAHTIANALAAIALSEQYDPPLERSPAQLTAAELAEYEGQYQLHSGDVREVRLSGDRLVTKRSRGPEYRLLPLGYDDFYFAHDQMTMISFIRNDAEEIIAHLLRQAFDQDTAWLVSDVQ